jgi:hypothetical protein
MLFNSFTFERLCRLSKSSMASWVVVSCRWMGIAASMAIEDEVDLETIAESVVAEGSLAVRRIS